MQFPLDVLIDFSPKANRIAAIALGVLVTLPFYFGALIAYGLNAVTLNVGYAPVQTVPFSHAMHVGKLGINCGYCHSSVEYSAHANIPPAQTCMNCHRLLFPRSIPLEPIRASYYTGNPVPWVKINDLPDYVYFDHSAHANAGVGCDECHGQINHMDQIAQSQPLNMAWCLDCHRHPEVHLRPRAEVMNPDWIPPTDRAGIGKQLCREYRINASADCVTCHR